MLWSFTPALCDALWSFTCALSDAPGAHVRAVVLPSLPPSLYSLSPSQSPPPSLWLSLPCSVQADDSRDANIKIADFGFACDVSGPNGLHGLCGSPGSVLSPCLAPKVLV
eukprot:3552013-Rhodomonas_salina.1